MSVTGKVTFNYGAQQITTYLDEQVPTLTGGTGGWTQVQRPKRDTMTQWDGRAPFQLTFGVLLDAFRTDGSLESDIAKLETLATPVRDTNGFIVGDPPSITMSGPLPHTELPWVIDSMEMGEWEWLTNTIRTRQQINITLTEFIAGPVFGIAPPVTTYALYNIKKGDTPGSIAAHHLGGKKNWKVLATMNPNFKIRQPTTPLPAGRVLRRPLKGWK